ncbi:DEKNAAC100120 [Brettanomyces naardenensis]|uniref:DEKNAAC100120 n=1 Tax=Brettanomyces naardenensis TaxID=13370 RepID=A0A448YF82_BRENA|nr:DEKNAAC100120 [Brettanomyces naardenensis]
MSIFFVLFLVMLLMILVIVVLPQLSGVASYHSNPDYLRKQKEKELASLPDHKEPITTPIGSSTYIPPDEVEGLSTTTATAESAASHLKNFGSDVYNKVKTAKITHDDIPVKLSLSNEADLQQQIRKRGRQNPAKANNDPNSYDYDLDELIDEELDNDKKETEIVSEFTEA